MQETAKVIKLFGGTLCYKLWRFNLNNISGQAYLSLFNWSSLVWLAPVRIVRTFGAPLKSALLGLLWCSHSAPLK